MKQQPIEDNLTTQIKNLAEQSLNIYKKSWVKGAWESEMVAASFYALHKEALKLKTVLKNHTKNKTELVNGDIG